MYALSIRSAYPLCIRAVSVLYALFIRAVSAVSAPYPSCLASSSGVLFFLFFFSCSFFFARRKDCRQGSHRSIRNVGGADGAQGRNTEKKGSEDFRERAKLLTRLLQTELQDRWHCPWQRTAHGNAAGACVDGPPAWKHNDGPLLAGRYLGQYVL